jgi:hypothetical protein
VSSLTSLEVPAQPPQGADHWQRYRNAVITSAVHDQLAPAFANGSFEQSNDELARTVRRWATPLVARGSDSLERLGARMLRCRPYDGGSSRRVSVPWCRCLICPHCFARKLGKLYDKLSAISDPYIRTFQYTR